MIAAGETFVSLPLLEINLPGVMLIQLFLGRVVLLYPGWQLPNVAYSLAEQEND